MSLPPETTIEDVKVKINQTNTNPNVGKVTNAVLKDGPQAYKIATLFEILDGTTKKFHHYSLRLDQIKRNKSGWHATAGRSVSLEDTKDKEVNALYMFLAAVYGDELRDQKGRVRLISSSDYKQFEHLKSFVPNIGDEEKLELLRQILTNITDPTFGDLKGLFEETNGQTLQHIAAASRMVEYTAAYQELQRLVDDPSTGEAKFQKHLEKNPWMFGSEYSELLSRRIWTRDNALDYTLRRTVDGYLEIVEIKTAFSDALFIYDKSRNCRYPSANLSSVIGQVMQYIEEVDRNRDSIVAHDGADALKIRARAIVGRDGDAEQQVALRNFNSHLHRIEVITFDQLLKIARRVLLMFQQEESTPPSITAGEFDDDIPF
jgi:hypothetical protein